MQDGINFKSRVQSSLSFKPIKVGTMDFKTEN